MHMAVEVTVVTIGGEDAEKQLRTALAMGADKAVLINTEDDLDELDQFSTAIHYCRIFKR